MQPYYEASPASSCLSLGACRLGTVSIGNRARMPGRLLNTRAGPWAATSYRSPGKQVGLFAIAAILAWPGTMCAGDRAVASTASGSGACFDTGVSAWP